jgi:predicted outer membrane repeat protein
LRLSAIGLASALLTVLFVAVAPAHAAGIPSVRPEPQPDNPFVSGDQSQKVVDATCANLQSKLNVATRDQFIRLNSSDGTVGTAGRKLCNSAYTLTNPQPSSVPQTPDYGVYLVGDPTDGNVDGFDGFDLGNRIFTGTDTNRFTVQALVFQNSFKTGKGGAIDISGDSALGVFDSEFTANQATDRGGAIHVADTQSSTAGGNSFQGNLFGSTTDATKGNKADIGGAVSVESGKSNVGSSGAGGNVFAHNSAKSTGGALDWDLSTGQNATFDNNLFTHNTAGGSGGGARINSPGGGFLSFFSETFENNSLDPVDGGPTGDHRGGGLLVQRTSGASTQQENSVFRENTIGGFNDQDQAGAGEAIVGNSLNISSRRNKWLSNTVVQAGVDFDAEGGGLAVIGDGSHFTGFLDVFAGNLAGSEIVGAQTGAQNGTGGGIYTGDSNTLELSDTTVAGNKVGPGGTFPGLAGNGSDALILVNAIVSNPGPPDIGGFSTANTNVSYTDACRSDGTPFPGTGNICADPKLLNPDTPGVAGTGIRETSQSPTIDKGNDANFIQRLGEDPREDFEGNLRPVDGDGDGHTTDMGAYESPEVAPRQTQQPQVTKPAPPPAPLAAAVVCGRREISLVRADLRRHSVVLTGLVASRFAGKRVTILANYNPAGKATTLGTVTATSAGQFTATVKRPPAGKVIKARFRAKVDRFTSVPLKLPQSVSSRSVHQNGSTIEFRGKVKRSVLGRGNTVVVKRLVCGRYHKVGEAKPDGNGNFVVRFAAPALGTSAFYRPETTVLDRPGGSRYVKQYGRAISITVTSQTG